MEIIHTASFVCVQFFIQSYCYELVFREDAPELFERLDSRAGGCPESS